MLEVQSGHWEVGIWGNLRCKGAAALCMQHKFIDATVWVRYTLFFFCSQILSICLDRPTQYSLPRRRWWICTKKCMQRRATQQCREPKCSCVVSARCPTTFSSTFRCSCTLGLWLQPRKSVKVQPINSLERLCQCTLHGLPPHASVPPPPHPPHQSTPPPHHALLHQSGQHPERCQHQWKHSQCQHLDLRAKSGVGPEGVVAAGMLLRSYPTTNGLLSGLNGIIQRWFIYQSHPTQEPGRA